MSITLAHSTQNDTRLEEFEALVNHLGENKAMGDEALASFAIAFVRAVYDGVISLDKDAAGDDASARYFKKYSAAEGKKKFHDRSEGSQKAQISKVRQLEKAAALGSKFDFVDVLNRGVVIRQQAHRDGIEVKSPFPAYVDLAREQLKVDDELDDDVIYATVIKGDNTKEKTVEGQLKKAAKILEDIQTGKHPGVLDQSPEIITAYEQINERIGTLMTLAKKAKLNEEASELGLRLTYEPAVEDTTGDVYAGE